MPAPTRKDVLKLGAAAFLATLLPGLATAYNPKERLLVAVMALKGGELVADESETYRPYHQHNEQVMTLDIGEGPARRTVFLSIWDRDAGGVNVALSTLDERGEHRDRREFVMYPFMNAASTRVERLRLPVKQASASAQRFEPETIELHITMKRVERSY